MLFVFTEWGDTIEQLQQVQLTNNHVNDGRNQMKKLSVFSMIAICIFLINSFTTFAERAYPPGAIVLKKSQQILILICV